MHIIVLWWNEKAPHVEALCQKTLSCRDAYHHKLIENLSQKGYHITYEDAKKYSPYNIVFKIHIILALMEKYQEEMTPEKYRGLFASKTSKETDLQMGYIDIQKGIEAIQKAVSYTHLDVYKRQVFLYDYQVHQLVHQP